MKEKEGGEERASRREGLLTHTIYYNKGGIVAILYAALGSDSNPACILSSMELFHVSNQQVPIGLVNVKAPA